MLISDLLSQNKIPIHRISSRVKSESSLSRKIDIKNNKYKSIEEVTDLIGIRIITLFEDDVENIVSFLQDEFDLDEKNFNYVLLLGSSRGYVPFSWH